MATTIINQVANTGIASDCASCNGLSVDELGYRYLQAIPGQSITYTARVLASAQVDLTVLGDDGITIDTEYNHCLAVDDPVHICFNDGVCTPMALDPCLFIESVPADNQFTLKDSEGNQVTFTRQDVDDNTPDDTGSAIAGWIARAANLTGFQGKLTLRVNDSRQDSLLGVGAIRSGRNQLQIKGHWSDKLAIGDQLTLNDFVSTVEAFRDVSTCDDVPYTVVQVASVSDIDIPFTDNYLIYFEPAPLTLQAESTSPSCGWITVNLQGSETIELLKHKQEGITDIGTWAFTLSWGTQSLPAHMKQEAPVVWSNVFDSGTLLV